MEIDNDSLFMEIDNDSLFPSYRYSERLMVMRSFEPKRGTGKGSLRDYFDHPDRVRESIVERLPDGKYREFGGQADWDFLNGFCVNYCGRGGIAWIVGRAPRGASCRDSDKFYACEDPFTRIRT